MSMQFVANIFNKSKRDKKKLRTILMKKLIITIVGLKVFHIVWNNLMNKKTKQKYIYVLVIYWMYTITFWDAL